MVFKLLTVILTLLVLDATAHSQHRYQIDLYKYGLITHHDKRQDDDIPIIKTTLKPCGLDGDKTCNDPRSPMQGVPIENSKRAWDRLDLLDLLVRSLPHEENSAPVILVPRYFEDTQSD